MSSRWVTPLLLTLCIGGVIASGVFSWRLQALSQQIDGLSSVVKRPSPIQQFASQETAVVSVSAETQAQVLSLRGEITMLREALVNVQGELKGLAKHEQSEIVMDDDQIYEQREKQLHLSELVSEAIGRGYWSHADAETFRNRSIGLAPQSMNMIAADIIRAIEEGRMEMPNDLMIPF